MLDKQITWYYNLCGNREPLICGRGDYMDYTFLLDLAIILLSTKVLGLLMKKLGLP